MRKASARTGLPVAAHCSTNTVEFAFQPLNPRAQCYIATNSDSNEQMNVIGHEDVAPDTDAKINSTVGVLYERSVHLGICEHAGASMSVKCHEINWLIEPLKNQIQSWRLSLKIRRTTIL
jgi:hypothetical protein